MHEGTFFPTRVVARDHTLLLPVLFVPGCEIFPYSTSSTHPLLLSSTYLAACRFLPYHVGSFRLG